MELINICDTGLSDCHKDAYGFRPRHYKEWWTAEELQAEYDRLGDMIAENEAQEAADAKHRASRHAAHIRYLIDTGAGSRKEAIRWDIQAEGLDVEWGQDREHYIYRVFGEFWTPESKALQAEVKRLFGGFHL